jgi:hypothetical protein
MLPRGMASRNTRPAPGLVIDVPTRDQFSALIKRQVRTRLVQAQELAQDAKYIESAWERRDVDSLLALNVLSQTQAVELRRLWAAV